MSIPQSAYVQITSSVGGSAAISIRQYILRLFTDNPLVPTGKSVDFNNANDVGTYFGTTSQEYLRAVFYFGWVSKTGNRPTQISFGRWADADTAPMIFGAPQAQAIATWNAISSGSFGLTLGSTTNTMSGLDFSTAPNLAGVASIIQAAIRTKTGSMWTAATVSYDPVRGSFNFTGGATGANAIAVIAGTGGSDIAGQLGWLSINAILSNGVTTQTITQLLTQSSGLSNNFGSFAFIPSLTQSQIVEAATWNNTQNVEFMYTVPVTADNVVAIQAAIANIGGITLTLSPLSTEYPELAPSMILAATDYTQLNAVQNYMFNQFNLTPSVLTLADKNTYDAINVNYYGQTQEAGQNVSFYQTGVMQGLPVDPADQNVYANEMWFKDQSAADIMSSLLILPQIPANVAGRATLLSILQGDINQALLNGTIQPGKTLTTNQIADITVLSGDPQAWQQVQNKGYWVDAAIVPIVVNNVTKYQATYTLIYGKDDVIRKVIGRDILI